MANDKISKIKVNKVEYDIEDVVSKSIAEKAISDIGADTISLLQGSIDDDGTENSSSFYLRTKKINYFKLEVNDGYSIGFLVQYDLSGAYISTHTYNMGSYDLSIIDWSPNKIIVTDKEYLWSAIIYKGNIPNVSSITPKENVIKSFLNGLYYYMQGNEEDANSAAAQAKMVIDRTISKLPNEEDLTVSDEGKMQFANRSAEIMNDKVSSLGYVVLRKNKSFAEQVVDTNTIYEVRYEFDLNGGTVELKDNCTLKFNGGKLINGTINGVNSFIEADYTKHIFTSITLTGVWENNASSPMWYGGKPDAADSSAEIQMCFDDIFRQKFIPRGNWNIKNTLLVRGNTNVDVLLEGENVNAENNVTNITKIITTDDIPIIKVEFQPHEWLAKTFTIKGGMLFANNSSYSSAALIISGNNNSKVISCHLHTTICTVRSCPPNSIGVLIVADDNNTGHVTYVRNHCNIGYFGIGVKSQRGTGAAWITGVQDYAHIWMSRQAIVVDKASAFYIGGEYQPGDYYEGEDKTPFISVDGNNVVIGCKVWDLTDVVEGTHANNIGIEISETSTNCVFEGLALELFPRWCIFNTNSLSEGMANIYKPLTTQRYNYGFDPYLENSIRPNINTTIEINTSNCTITNAENLFNPYATAPAINATTEDATLEITANINNSYLSVLAIAIDINRYESFKQFSYELYNAADELIKSGNRTLVNGNSYVVSREFFTFEDDYNEIVKIKFFFSGVYKVGRIGLCGIYVKSIQNKAKGELSYLKDIIPTALVNQKNESQPITYNTGNDHHLTVGDNILQLKRWLGSAAEYPLFEIQISGNPLAAAVLLRLSTTKGIIHDINIAIGDYTNYPVVVSTISGGGENIGIVVKHSSVVTDSASVAYFQFGIITPYSKTAIDFVSVQGIKTVKPISSYNDNYADITNKVIKRYTVGDSQPNLSYGDNTGFQYFDKPLSKPIWWNGEEWVDANADRAANTTDTSKPMGLGYKTLSPNKSFAEQVTESNTVYEIRYNFDLGGETVTLKEGCTLKFNGGKLTNFKNITLSNTIIEAPREHIFEVGEMLNKGVIDATEPSENCNGEFESSITGTIKNNKIYPEWFGAKADDVNDDSDAIQYALNTAYNVGGEVEFNGSAIKRYKVDYTIYLPPNSKMTAKNRPPKIYSELSGSNNKAEIYFTCRYLFRTKKNKNTDAESTRLTNEICVVMDSLKICGRYSRPKVTIDGTAASGYEDEITVYGDPYWVRKTYVFYGTKLKRSVINNVTAIYIGTFIYGNILNLSQISNNYISFHRAFSLGRKSDVNHSSTILNSGVSGLTDDLYELGYDTTITYPNGKSYTGYYEEIPTLKNIGGIIDSKITHNYLSGNGMYRPICFYETQLAMTGINNNYIDFCFSVFYNYTTVNSSCNTICNNIIDYCLMFYLHSCKDILVAENQIHKMSHEAVIDTYIRGHFDEDTTNFSFFDKEVLNYKASFFVCDLCRRVDVINNTFYDTDALNNYKGGPYWASVHIKDNRYYNTPNDVICTKGLDEAYNGMNPCSDIYFDCFEKVLVDDNYISPSAQPIRPLDELEHNNRLRMNTSYPSDIIDCEYNAKYQYVNGELTVFNGKLNNSNTNIAMIRPKSRGIVFNPDTKVWGFADRPTTDSAYAYMPNGIRARKGVGATRPNPGDLNNDDIGFVFFDTSIGKPVWWNGTSWVDYTENGNTETVNEYVPLKYLENTGTQYIDTGLIPSENDVITLDFEVTDSAAAINSDKILIDARDETNAVRVSTWGDNKKWYARFGYNAGSTSAAQSAVIRKGSLIFSKDSLIVNGVTVISSMTFTAMPNSTLKLFSGVTTDGAISGPSYARISSCKITRDGETIMNLIPVQRSEDGVLGMRDIVSDNFFINAGTGTFNYELAPVAGEATIKKYPSLTDEQKAAIQSLMDDYYNNRNVFYYEFTHNRNAFTSGSTCYDSTRGKFKQCCATFVQHIMMGRSINDFLGKNASTYSSIITKTDVSEFGYYFDFKYRKYLYGLTDTDENGDTKYYGYVQPNDDNFEGSYSYNSYYHPDSTKDKKQNFNGFVNANDMARELYEMGCEIPFSELEVGDIIFTLDNDLNDNSSMYNFAAWRNIYHVGMVYDVKQIDASSKEIYYIECTSYFDTETRPIEKPYLSSSQMDLRFKAFKLTEDMAFCARMPIAFGYEPNVPDSITATPTP